IPQSLSPSVQHASFLLVNSVAVNRQRDEAGRRRDESELRTRLDEIARHGLWLHVRDELVKFARHIGPELAARDPDVLTPRTRKRVGSGPVKRDRKTEARDKWIYNLCCERMAYGTI